MFGVITCLCALCISAAFPCPLHFAAHYTSLPTAFPCPLHFYALRFPTHCISLPISFPYPLHFPTYCISLPIAFPCPLHFPFIAFPCPFLHPHLKFPSPPKTAFLSPLENVPVSCHGHAADEPGASRGTDGSRQSPAGPGVIWGKPNLACISGNKAALCEPWGRQRLAPQPRWPAVLFLAAPLGSGRAALGLGVLGGGGPPRSKASCRGPFKGSPCSRSNYTNNFVLLLQINTARSAGHGTMGN